MADNAVEIILFSVLEAKLEKFNRKNFWQFC